MPASIVQSAHGYGRPRHHTLLSRLSLATLRTSRSNLAWKMLPIIPVLFTPDPPPDDTAGAHAVRSITHDPPTQVAGDSERTAIRLAHRSEFDDVGKRIRVSILSGRTGRGGKADEAAWSEDGGDAGRSYDGENRQSSLGFPRLIVNFLR